MGQQNKVEDDLQFHVQRELWNLYRMHSFTFNGEYKQEVNASSYTHHQSFNVPSVMKAHAPAEQGCSYWCTPAMHKPLWPCTEMYDHESSQYPETIFWHYLAKHV